MTGRRATWAWGAAAAVLGAVGHLFTDPHDGLSATATRRGADFILGLDRVPLHVGVVAGFLASAACWSRPPAGAGGPGAVRPTAWPPRWYPSRSRPAPAR